MKRVSLNLEGFVRVVRETTKTIVFAVPVYAGGKDDNKKTKWINIVSFNKDKHKNIQKGDYVLVKDLYVRLNDWVTQDGETRTSEEWILGRDGSIEIIDPPDFKKPEQKSSDDIPF